MSAPVTHRGAGPVGRCAPCRLANCPSTHRRGATSAPNRPPFNAHDAPLLAHLGDSCSRRRSFCHEALSGMQLFARSGSIPGKSNLDTGIVTGGRSVLSPSNVVTHLISLNDEEVRDLFLLLFLLLLHLLWFIRPHDWWFFRMR